MAQVGTTSSGSLFQSNLTGNGILYADGSGVVNSTASANYGLLITGATGLPSVLANGTTGQVLTATTSGTPSWAAAGGGITTINGDSGSVTGSTVKIWTDHTDNNSGSSILFSASGTNLTLNVTDFGQSVCIGQNAGPATAYINSKCTCLGVSAGNGLTSGVQNTFIGNAAGDGISTGNYLIAMGYRAGHNYSTGRSSCIIIGNTGTGIDQDNTVVIGTQGSGNTQQNACQIAGITGATVTGAAVLCSTTGLLGTVASSLEYKTNIQDLKSDNFIKLRPVSFKYKKQDNNDTHYGMIAEEVEKLCPDLVLYRDGKPDSIKYHEMPALLLVEIQKLKAEINDLKASLKK